MNFFMSDMKASSFEGVIRSTQVLWEIRSFSRASAAGLNALHKSVVLCSDTSGSWTSQLCEKPSGKISVWKVQSVLYGVYTLK